MNELMHKQLRTPCPGISLEGMMLKLKLQNFGHLMRRVDSLEKTLSWEGLGAGGDANNRGWDGWTGSRTQCTWVWVNSGSWWWTGRPGVLWFMGLKRVGHDWATELNWPPNKWCRFLLPPGHPLSPLSSSRLRHKRSHDLKRWIRRWIFHALINS